MFRKGSDIRNILVNLGLVLASLALVLGVGEIGVRIAYPRLADYNLEMWRYSSELKQPLERKNLPFLHYPNREGQYYGVSIKTNSEGLRDVEHDHEKPADKTRVVMIGDSFMLGWGVRAEDDIPSNLSRMLNRDGDRYEVINLGVGNYNSTMEADLFEWKGLAFHPDIAVLLYFVNDPEPVPRVSWSSRIVRKRSYLLAFLFDRYVALRPLLDRNFRWQEYYTSLYAPDTPALEENRAALRHLVDLCKKNNIRLLIANYPELHELKNYPFPQATEYIRSLAAESQVPFVDLLPAFAPHAPESLWVSNEDTHGNALACQIAAQGIYEALKSDPK
jgi:lysophospholipase L1-like esterase